MKAKSILYPVVEYQSFGVEEILRFLRKSKNKNDADEDKHPEGTQNAIQAKKFFASLEKFARNENNHGILRYCRHNQLKTQNHVGIIQTPHGTLEIYPKCFKDQLEHPSSESKISQEEKNKFSEALKEAYRFDSQKRSCGFERFSHDKFPTPPNPKNLLLNFLKTLKDTPFKHSKTASLRTFDLPLLDIFIQMFLDELRTIIQRGIRQDYITQEDQHFCLKGKLLFKEQIRYNAVRKERFFTANDEFIADIAENRIIKSTLLFLKTQTQEPRILASLRAFLHSFENISPLIDPSREFSLLKPSRHFDYYQNILRWCELFLQGRSFAPYSGKDEAYALLFPTEKLFESYVASMLQKHNLSLEIKSQSKGKYLIQEDQRDAYALKPDLWIEKEKIIIDTKWKINHDSKIAQSDLYQMWAYVCKYEAREAWLIYPLCERTKALQEEHQAKKWIFKASKSLSFCHESQDRQPNHEERTKNPPTHAVFIKIIFAPLPFL